MVTTDINLHSDVVEELAFDPSVDAAKIGVAVSGGVVTLTGTVTSYAQKLAAEQAVKRVRGVHGIAEELTIEIASLHRRTDAELAKAALDALRWNISVPIDAVLVKVEHGWVTLTGTVEWEYQRESARQAIVTLAGVLGVMNEITLRQHVVARDIQTKIHEALLRHAAIDADKIQIEASGGTVTLRGPVHSWAEREDAARAAFSVAGVWDVKNLTSVL